MTHTTFYIIYFGLHKASLFLTTKFYAFINSNLFKNKVQLASLGFIFRILFVLPIIVFSNILGIPWVLFVWYPISSCILYIIISNFNLVEFRPRHLLFIFVSSLLFTIMLKNLIVSTIVFASILIGVESFILVLMDYILADSLYILAIIPLSVADPDQVAGQPFSPNNANRRLGLNLVTELSRPEYKSKDMSNYMLGPYGVFVLGAIQNSTSPDGIAMHNKLLANWSPTSGNGVPWWALNNNTKLRTVLRNV